MDKIKALWGKAVDWCKSAWEKAADWVSVAWLRLNIRALPGWAGAAVAVALAIGIGWWFMPKTEAPEPTTAVVYPPVYIPPPVATQPTAPVQKTVRVEKAKSNRSPVSQTQSDDVVLPEPEPAVSLAPITPITRESVDLYRASLRKE